MAPKRAACPANQAALERLIVQRAAVVSTTDHIASMIWKRALASLAAATEPVTTHAEALALPYIGHTMANHLLGRRPTPAEQATLPKKGKGGAKSASVASSPESTSTTTTVAAAAQRRPKQGQKLPNKRAKIDTSNKESVYEKAVYAAENWKNLSAATPNGSRRRHLTWRVVLLVDNRERKSEHMVAKCQMSGIPCEVRQLPIGDMAWITQGIATESNNDLMNNISSTSSPSSKTVVVELMLGTIIERKTPDDLKGSIFGTRYMEQRLRLQHCGLPQVMYLIEGDMNKPVFSCPFETLHTAVWETRLHLGFSIVHTAHMAETVTTLKRMHRRILQRTFPRAFSSNGTSNAATMALPVFAESTLSLDERRRSIEADARRRRRRRQSLAEMTFDMDPVPPLGMERFVSYDELKAKVQLDRQSGTRSVGNIHRMMLKQVQGFDVKKCHAVAERFPTTQSLLSAFGTAPTQTKTLVSMLTTQSKTSANRTVGTKSAEHLRIAYSKYNNGSSADNTGEERGGIHDQDDDNDKHHMFYQSNNLVSSAAAGSAAVGSAATNVVLKPSASANRKAPPKATASLGTKAIPKPKETAASRTAKSSWDDKGLFRDDANDSRAREDSNEGLSQSSWQDEMEHQQFLFATLNDSTTTTATPAMLPTMQRTKKLLNTSIGSLLRSSDDDDSPFAQEIKSIDMACAKANAKKRQRLPNDATTHPADTVWLDCSDDGDDDDDEFAATTTKSSFAKAQSSILNDPSQSQDTDVIEID